MRPIVGCDAELAVVDAFLDGRGTRVLTITGEPGIGKTTLWREAVERARTRGALVLAARPAESEARLSFAGLADLVDGVWPSPLVAIPAPQREALDGVLLRSGTDRQPERRLAGTALLSLLRSLAEHDVLIAIDDLHWLDPSSARALEFAFRRLQDDHVRLLVSTRPGDHRSTSILDEGAVRIELGPLSVAALHRIIADALGTTFPRPTLVRIARVSDGNPFYALEIARLLARRDDRGRTAAVPVPEDLRTLVADRVAALPARTRAALLRAAALPRPDLTLVDLRALSPAEEDGLVSIGVDGRIEFAHPLFASAVYASAPQSRRATTHRALAREVADPEERARHLALSRERPDEDAARDAEAAARAARLRGAPDAAAELYALASKLLPKGAPGADELRLGLAESLLLASDFQGAAELLEGLRASLEPGELRARALLMLSEIDFWRQGESVAAALAEEALADARDPLLRAHCHASIAMHTGTVDLPKAAASARTALGLLEGAPAPAPELFAKALGARVRADLFLGRGYDGAAAARALELEQRSPPPEVDMRVVFKLGQWLRYVDDLDGARGWLAQAEQAAHDEGDESSLANILLNQMIVETWAGNWQQAAELAGRMQDAFEQLGVSTSGADPWRVYVDAHAGRLETVRAAAERATPEEPIVEMIWSRCLGLAELGAGESHAADRHLTEAMAELDRVDFREPAIWRVDGDAVEAAVAVGDLARAETIVDRFEARAACSQIPWNIAVSARCRGVVLAARGELASAADVLDRSLAAHERCPVPFARARTLHVRGQVLRRLKRRREARESLEEALAIFGRLGAAPWADRAEADLRRVAVRRAPRDLSATELRIAKLAASGLTNRAIATEVFLSRKAVEANLARAYRKLGIRSRAQLARALDARDSA